MNTTTLDLAKKRKLREKSETKRMEGTPSLLMSRDRPTVGNEKVYRQAQSSPDASYSVSTTQVRPGDEANRSTASLVQARSHMLDQPIATSGYANTVQTASFKSADVHAQTQITIPRLMQRKPTSKSTHSTAQYDYNTNNLSLPSARGASTPITFADTNGITENEGCKTPQHIRKHNAAMQAMILAPLPPQKLRPTQAAVNVAAQQYPDRVHPPMNMDPDTNNNKVYVIEGPVQEEGYVDEVGVVHQRMVPGEFFDTEYMQPGQLSAVALEQALRRADAARAAQEDRDAERKRRKNPYTEPPNKSLDLLIAQVERLMREYEQNAQYADAERTRQHLENLKRRRHEFSRRELELLQEEDVRAFLQSVVQQQRQFDRLWAARLVEHKLRADDLIAALKRKQQREQEELYLSLQNKRVPRFSVELLSMRKRQVLLARGRKYVEADELRRKADQMEAVELDRIRRSSRQANQAQFEALLRRQQCARHGLAEKLKDERLRLLELKAQDFLCLRHRLKNAELTLKRTHLRQGLVADGKLAPVFSTVDKHKVASTEAKQVRKRLGVAALRGRVEKAEKEDRDAQMLEDMRRRLQGLRDLEHENEAEDEDADSASDADDEDAERIEFLANGEVREVPAPARKAGHKQSLATAGGVPVASRTVDAGDEQDENANPDINDSGSEHTNEDVERSENDHASEPAGVRDAQPQPDTTIHTAIPAEQVEELLIPRVAQEFLSENIHYAHMDKVVPPDFSDPVYLRGLFDRDADKQALAAEAAAYVTPFEEPDHSCTDEDAEQQQRWAYYHELERRELARQYTLAQQTYHGDYDRALARASGTGYSTYEHPKHDPEHCIEQDVYDEQ